MSIKELLKELFIAPFLSTIIEFYNEKTKYNLNKVQLVVYMTTQKQINTNWLNHICKNLGNNSQFLNAIISLMKVYKDKLDLARVSVNPPSADDVKRLYDEIASEIIHKYYNPLTEKCEDISMQKSLLEKELKESFKYWMCNTRGSGGYQNIEDNPLVRNIRLLEKQLGITHERLLKEKLILDGNDFSNIDFAHRCRPAHIEVVKNCDFSGCTFGGDGSTASCIHWDASGSNFTDAIFNGKICAKTSNFNDCNFTRADITSIVTYNTGEMTMQNCDLTDTTIYVGGKTLKGKLLIGYMLHKNINIDGYHYSSPDDGGYNPNEEYIASTEPDDKKEETERLTVFDLKLYLLGKLTNFHDLETLKKIKVILDNISDDKE